MKMSEKGIILCFLASAIVALSCISQVSTTDTKIIVMSGFPNYETVYQICIRSEDGKSVIGEYFKKHKLAIESLKSTKRDEIREIYEEIVKETLFPLSYFTSVISKSENYKETVALLFYIKYLVLYSHNLMSDIKVIIAIDSNHFTQEEKEKFINYLTVTQEILSVYIGSPDYTKFTPIVKDLYLEKQPKNDEVIEKAKKLFDNIEAVLKIFFDNEAPRRFGDKKYLPMLKQFQQLYSNLFPGILMPVLKEIKEIDSFKPEQIKSFVNQIDDSKVLIKTPDETSRIIKIIKMFLSTFQGWKFSRESDGAGSSQ